METGFLELSKVLREFECFVFDMLAIERLLDPLINDYYFLLAY